MSKSFHHEGIGIGNGTKILFSDYGVNEGNLAVRFWDSQENKDKWKVLKEVGKSNASDNDINNIFFGPKSEKWTNPHNYNLFFHNCQDYSKISNPVSVIVATNGVPLLDDSALYDWYKEFLKKAGKFFLTQVTNVPKYYPRKFTEKEIYWLSKLKNCSVITDPTEIALYPQGRALDLDEEYQTRGPKCINARLVSKQLYAREAFTGNVMNNTIYTLFKLISSQALKFCSPRVNIDGTISIGESLLCPPIGTVYDHSRKLFINILNCNCEKCKIAIDVLKKNSPPAYMIFKNKIN